MTDKKMVLYIQDEEYARRLFRFLSGRRQPGLQIERVTKREDFWVRRRQEAGDESLYWITDDLSGCEKDSHGTKHRIVLTGKTDEKQHFVSVCQRAEDLYRALLCGMDISGEGDVSGSGPKQGIYVTYSPWGEEGSVLGALLSQELAGYGDCVYVNMSAFPHFYEKSETERGSHLGELFFRLEYDSYETLVKGRAVSYGAAVRLPGVSHYRDLWDISDEDRKIFLEKLQRDCHYTYVVVVFNDIREAMPAVSYSTGFFLAVRPSSALLPTGRWERYQKTEKKEGTGVVTYVTMPENWNRWIDMMEENPPDRWLMDEEKKTFISKLWREEEIHG